MYVPKHFQIPDPSEIRDLIAAHDFALFVTTAGDGAGDGAGGAPEASHLPVLHDPAAGPHGTLHAHMARANPQWRAFEAMAREGAEVLVVFQGPHAYVSPTWYETDRPSVPTWNYLAVHATGVPRVLDEADEVRNLLVRLSEKHEAGRTPPWRLADQPADFVEGMMKGIVAFEIPIARWDAKAKLSQNRPPEQAARVADALEAGNPPLAAAMRRALDRR